MSAFSLEFSNRASRAGTALLVALAIVLGPYAACAEQPGIRPGFSLQAFCADPEGNFSQLRTALRPRIGVSSTDRRFDEIVSGVLWRLVLNCAKLDPDKDVNVNLDLYVRNSRIEAWRQDKRLEFQDELIELVPAESDATGDDILDVIQKKATTRQQMVFTMLAQGMTQPEIADHLGVAVGTVNAEKQRIEAVLKSELQISEPRKTAPRSGRSVAARPLALIAPQATAPAATVTSDEPSMVRVQSQLGGEIAAALRSGAEVMPTGNGYAGPVMTFKIPRAHLSGAPVDGIVMLPVPIILQSNTAGEQEMVAAAAREIGDDKDGDTRTFALYAFCKDEHLEAPGDLSRYSFKSEVSDSKMADIVMRSDLRQPDKISERLWALSTGG
jgi:DNA-directed RNA polymerase specialized sigma24 family protein